MSNCEFVKQSRLEDANDPNEIGIEDKLEELLKKVERMDIGWKMEMTHLENKLEPKTVEVENLQKRLTDVELQFESRVE